MKSCRNCYYMSEWDDEGKCGYCRRYPPIVLEYIKSVYTKNAYDGSTSYPTVEFEDWCGEFKEKVKQ